MEASILRLIAEDADGLAVIAAAVQDATVLPQDIKLNARARSFGLELNRFQWERAGARRPWFRSRAVLAFAGVLGAQSAAMPKGVDAVLSLLDVRFHPAAEPPGGQVRLIFAHGAEVRLDVECLDVTLLDTGPAWPTRRKPDHGTAA
jgi:hypothetical protein